MSWTQGVTPREDLPERFVKWADGLGKGELQYITWFDDVPGITYLDFGEKGSFKIDFSGVD